MSALWQVHDGQQRHRHTVRERVCLGLNHIKPFVFVLLPYKKNLGSFLCGQVSNQVTRRIQSPLILLKLTSGAGIWGYRFFSLPPISSMDSHSSVCFNQHVIHFSSSLSDDSTTLLAHEPHIFNRFFYCWRISSITKDLSLWELSKLFLCILSLTHTYVHTPSIPSLNFLKISFFYVQWMSPVGMKSLVLHCGHRLS